MDDVELRQQARRLIGEQRWFALATIDGVGNPAVSYVPFAPLDGAFGIVVSRLAAHTSNLLARPRASLLLVDGAEQSDPFARRRLSVSVTARPADPGSARAEAIWAALELRAGATAGVLRALPDFHAIALEPGRGRLVLGFASAHNLDATTLAELLHVER